MFINPTTSAPDSRVSGPTPSGMDPLHENDVFSLVFSIMLPTEAGSEFLEDPDRGIPGLNGMFQRRIEIGILEQCPV